MAWIQNNSRNHNARALGETHSPVDAFDLIMQMEVSAKFYEQVKQRTLLVSLGQSSMRSMYEIMTGKIFETEEWVGHNNKSLNHLNQQLISEQPRVKKLHATMGGQMEYIQYKFNAMEWEHKWSDAKYSNKITADFIRNFTQTLGRRIYEELLHNYNCMFTGIVSLPGTLDMKLGTQTDPYVLTADSIMEYDSNLGFLASYWNGDEFTGMMPNENTDFTGGQIYVLVPTAYMQLLERSPEVAQTRMYAGDVSAYFTCGYAGMLGRKCLTYYVSNCIEKYATDLGNGEWVYPILIFSANSYETALSMLETRSWSDETDPTDINPHYERRYQAYGVRMISNDQVGAGYVKIKK